MPHRCLRYRLSDKLYSNYVHTADQINATVPTPDHPNSPTKLDRSSPLEYFLINSISTRPILDHFPITVTWLLHL